MTSEVLTVTVTHQTALVWMACGRTFRCDSKDTRFYRQRLRRHKKRCTKCRQSYRLSRRSNFGVMGLDAWTAQELAELETSIGRVEFAKPSTPL